MSFVRVLQFRAAADKTVNNVFPMTAIQKLNYAVSFSGKSNVKIYLPLRKKNNETEACIKTILPCITSVENESYAKWFSLPTIFKIVVIMTAEIFKLKRSRDNC